jgi:hypothetical protein
MAVVVLVSAFFGMNALAATEELLNLCPVSRYIDPIQDNTLPYPQFYFPEHQVLATDPSFPCATDEPEKTSAAAELCLPGLCPVKSSFITASQKPMTWKPRLDALCQLKSLQQKGKEFNQKVNVNVIAFGGSMTSGLYLDGKCCWQRENRSSTCQSRQKSEIKLDPKVHYCHWFGELASWMRREYSNIQFSFYNMARNVLWCHGW